MSTRALLGSLFLLALAATPAMAQRRGGGGGGGGGFGPPGWREQQEKAKKEAEEQKKKDDAQKAEENFTKLLQRGWAALKEGDTGEASDAFADALQTKPKSGEAKLGVAMVRAAEGNWTQAAAQMDAAMKDKSVERLAIYNQAVAWARSSQAPRSVVALHKYLAANPDLIDEMVLNAQSSLVAGLDETARKGIGLMPNILRTIDQEDKVLASKKYVGQERWGVTWVPQGYAAKLRQAKARPPYPELPFVFPDGTTLPPKGGDATPNVLLPELAAELGKAWIAWIDPKPAEATVASASSPGDGSRPTTGPAGTAVASVGPPTGAGAPTTGPTFRAAAPPAWAVGSLGAATQPAGAKMTTVRGAAFAVGPDLLVTCESLVAGAATVSATDSDGMVISAEVVATDPITGLALIHVAGAKYPPMALAEACKAGPVHVACFSRAIIFQPTLDVLRGDLAAAGAGRFTMKMATHPRSAGSPVLDDSGRVVAVVSASREDDPAKLPVVQVDAIRRFCSGRVGPVAAIPSSPTNSVTQLTVTKKR